MGVKGAAQNVIAAIEGLAREIGRRAESTTPGGIDISRETVEIHAKAVLADYLLGDFKPVKPETRE